MVAWRQGEVHLLVKEQESAVKAVRLERLVGNIGQGKRARRAEGRKAHIYEQFVLINFDKPFNISPLILPENTKCFFLKYLQNPN